jgi:thioredoxin-dependent peroxiredoxin
LIGPDGILVEEWRGLKVPGHVEDVLKAVKALNKVGKEKEKEKLAA